MSRRTLQFLTLENPSAITQTCAIMLCGTTSFFTRAEINNLLLKNKMLLIIFHPDKNITKHEISIWQNLECYKAQFVANSISLKQIVKDILANIFLYNNLGNLYKYRLDRYGNLLLSVMSLLGDAKVEELIAKDISSSFDLFFIEKINAKRKIWKVITTSSAELQYLRFLKRKDVPLTEIHFYSEYHRKSIISLNYTKNLERDYLILIEPEPFYSDIFSSIREVKMSCSRHHDSKSILLVIGIWNHGGRNLLRKSFEFNKFIIQLAIDRSIKSKYRVIYKLHPNREHMWLFIKLLETLGVEVRSRSEKVLDLIMCADTVISWGSMSCVYAIELGKRVIYPKNKYLNFWIEYEKDVYEQNELVDVADCVSDVIKLAIGNSSSLVAADRRNKLHQIFGLSKVAEPNRSFVDEKLT